MRFSILVLIIFFCCPKKSSAQFHLGPAASFISDGNAFGVGANTLFHVYDDSFFGSVNGHYYFGGQVNWDLNFDVHYQFIEIGDDTFINPFSGLNIRAEDESNNDTDLGVGLNLGLFFHSPITDDFRIFIEAKYMLVINGLSGLGFKSGIFF